MQNDLTADDQSRTEKLVEGNDFYLEEGLMVLTRKYLLRRGSCCGNTCRNCPYDYEAVDALQKENFDVA